MSNETKTSIKSIAISKFNEMSLWKKFMGFMVTITLTYVITLDHLNNKISIFVDNIKHPGNVSHIEAFYFYIGTTWILVFFIIVALFIIYFGIRLLYLAARKEFDKLTYDFDKNLRRIIESNEDNLKIIRNEFKNDYLLEIKSSIQNLNLKNQGYFLERKYFQNKELNFTKSFNIKQKNQLSNEKIYVLSRDIKVGGVKKGFLDIVAKNIIKHNIRYRYVTRIDHNNYGTIKDTVKSLRSITNNVEVDIDPVEKEHNCEGELVTFTLMSHIHN